MKPIVRLIAVAGTAAACAVGGANTALAATAVPAASSAAAASAPQGPTLTFLGMTNIAVQKVRAHYPEAKLLEGFGTSPGGPTDDVAQVSSWRFVFQLPGNKTVMIQSTGWGTFADPVVSNRPLLGSLKINWTPLEYLDISDADAALKDAGYTDQYTSVTLRAPLYPGINEPFYIFNFADGSHVGVGLEDGDVVPFE